jgi:hypothetical protein
VPTPSMSEVTLYAQHQCEVQRLVAAHGMAAVPWPPTAYTGSTAFDLLFPERLALNRDLLFVLYAAPRALRRYVRVLQQTTRTASTLPTTDPPPSVSALATAARWAVVIPLVHQRLRVSATASTGCQQQHTELQEEALSASLLEWLQRFPAFADAYTYFQQLAETLRPLLNAPPSEPLRLLTETELPPPATRRRLRSTKTPRSIRRAYITAE